MLIPSVDIQDGRVVQLRGGEELVIDAGDPIAAAEALALVGEIAVIDLDAARGIGDNTAIIEQIVARVPCRVGGGIRCATDAIRWLDAGAARVIIGTAANVELLTQLPTERVLVALDNRNGKVVTHGWREQTEVPVEDRIGELAPHCYGFLVTAVEREGRKVGVDLDAATRLKQACGDRALVVAGGVATADEIAALDRAGIDAQVGMAIYDGTLGLADAFTAPLPGELWPTVVVDETGVALGLVYSNIESVRAALEARRGIYWSRTRGLWDKGATSGNSQRLIRIETDCDRDALRFVVEQQGRGFCHTGTRSCFGDGVFSLTDTARAIATSGERPDSYTQRLLSDPELLDAKLREEVDELLEAIDREHLIEEAADVCYFLMVRLARSDAGLDDVARVLQQRSRRVTRRPGDAKPGARR